MNYLFPIIVLANFAAGLTARTLDPVLPQVAFEFAITAQIAATLASAAAVSFAMIQLPLGAVADFFGKPRVILFGLTLLMISNFMGAFANSFELLLATRVLAGIAAGSTFPVALALTNDMFALDQRRVAISRIMAGAQIGNILGASISGILGDIVGWRGVLVTLGVVVGAASIAVAWGFRNQMGRSRTRLTASHVLSNYRLIVTHRHAQLCYFGAFCEGLLAMGVMPFIAAFFVEMGETRASIAGLVIGGLAVGGIVYALVIKRALPVLGEAGTMYVGAVLMGAMVMLVGFGPPWPVQFAGFVMLGYGFSSLHGGFMIFNSEVAPKARAASVSLSAFSFNTGMFAGPLLYGFALAHAPKLHVLLTFGSLMIAIGIGTTMLLSRKEAEP